MECTTNKYHSVLVHFYHPLGAEITFWAGGCVGAAVEQNRTSRRSTSYCLWIQNDFQLEIKYAESPEYGPRRS